MRSYHIFKANSGVVIRTTFFHRFQVAGDAYVFTTYFNDHDEVPVVFKSANFKQKVIVAEIVQKWTMPLGDIHIITHLTLLDTTNDPTRSMVTSVLHHIPPHKDIHQRAYRVMNNPFAIPF